MATKKTTKTDAAWDAMIASTGKPFADGGAYGSNCYADWRGCAILLRMRRYSVSEAETILRSNHMRWCCDGRPTTEGYGKVSVATFAAYLDRNDMDGFVGRPSKRKIVAHAESALSKSLAPEPHVLLVWELVPERNTFVLIPTSTLHDDDYDVLRAANGAYINSDTTPEQDMALSCINNALCPKPEYLADEHPKGSKWAMRWTSYVCPFGKPITPADGVVVTHVYCCGVMM